MTWGQQKWLGVLHAAKMKGGGGGGYLLGRQRLRELDVELDVHVAVLVGAAVLRHALVLDALPGVGGDDLPRGAGDLEGTVVQVLDGEGRAAEGLRQGDLLQGLGFRVAECRI